MLASGNLSPAMDCYIIAQPSPYTPESLCAYKWLDAYKYVVFYKDIGKGFLFRISIIV